MAVRGCPDREFTVCAGVARGLSDRFGVSCRRVPATAALARKGCSGRWGWRHRSLGSVGWMVLCPAVGCVGRGARVPTDAVGWGWAARRRGFHAEGEWLPAGLSGHVGVEVVDGAGVGAGEAAEVQGEAGTGWPLGAMLTHRASVVWLAGPGGLVVSRATRRLRAVSQLRIAARVVGERLMVSVAGGVWGSRCWGRRVRRMVPCRRSMSWVRRAQSSPARQPVSRTVPMIARMRVRALHSKAARSTAPPRDFDVRRQKAVALA